MKLNMYVVKNDLSCLYDGIYLFRNDTLASVSIASDMSRCHMRLDEYKLFKIGTFDNETADKCFLDNDELIAWDTRHCVESPMDLDTKQVQENISDIR